MSLRRSARWVLIFLALSISDEDKVTVTTSSPVPALANAFPSGEYAHEPPKYLPAGPVPVLLQNRVYTVFSKDLAGSTVLIAYSDCSAEALAMRTASAPWVA